jgi:hypothetical protein
MSDRATVLKQRAILAPLRKAAEKLREDNPLIAAAFSTDELVKLGIEQMIADERTLGGAISKALANPPSPSHNVTGQMVEVAKSAATRPEADLTPGGIQSAIKKAREERAAKPNEPTRQGGGKL